MERLRSGLYYAGLWAISLLFFAPIAWIVLASFKTRSDILAVPPKLFFTPTLENYVDLFQRQSLFLQLGNSVLLSLGAVVAQRVRADQVRAQVHVDMRAGAEPRQRRAGRRHHVETGDLRRGLGAAGDFNREQRHGFGATTWPEASRP